ncbi:MAG TPA: N,N-dimethylformamidase beta subunit family domain-containing protein [Pirellulales bacterium]|nr:N,N-dimethylformamidase beta subunit family domain-containing protein [Pirellulales bacterium]
MDARQQKPISRRAFLDGLAAAGASALALPLGARADETTTNPVAQENQRPGTRDWMLTKVEVEPKSRFRSPWIEGFCSAASVKAGDKLQFFVSTDPASRFTLEIFRTGYYGGDGGRSVKHLGEFAGTAQTDPPVAEKRLRNCQWEPCTELTIPADWLSGVYLGKLTALDSGRQSYVVFIVRDDRQADFLFQCSDHTWQAYNRWPSQFAIYDNGEHQWYWGGGVQVSFNRPYGKYCQIFDAPLSVGSGEWLLWEFPLAYWMESLGYDVTYISNQDTHRDPAGLRRAKGLLSVGHDEYWTIEMFDNVRAAVAEGLNVAFLSGNTMYGRVVFDDAARAFERVGVFAPWGETRALPGMKELKWGHPYGNELMGAHSTGDITGGADWICRLPEHWLFAGTGMKEGEGIPGLVGWEWHGDPAPIPGLEVVASGDTQRAPGQPNGGKYTATVYPGPKGNIVFNAATIWWADGLSEPPGYVRPKVYTEPKGPDRRVQQITKNVLERMRA